MLPSAVDFCSKPVKLFLVYEGGHHPLGQKISLGRDHRSGPGRKFIQLRTGGIDNLGWFHAHNMTRVRNAMQENEVPKIRFQRPALPATTIKSIQTDLPAEHR